MNWKYVWTVAVDIGLLFLGIVTMLSIVALLLFLA